MAQNGEKSLGATDGKPPDTTTGGKTPDTTNGGKTSDTETGGKTPDTTYGGKTPDTATGGKVPDTTIGGKIPDTTIGWKSPDTKSGGGPLTTQAGGKLHGRMQPDVELVVEQLLAEVPKKWEVLGDVVLLPQGCFSSEVWGRIANKLWNAVASCLGVTRVAMQAPVANNGKIAFLWFLL